MSQATVPVTVEKIGGTTMSDYPSVRDNIVLGYRTSPYKRLLVVSAYGGITDRLLEHKKSGQPGVFALFRADAGDDAWIQALEDLRQLMHDINAQWFQPDTLVAANHFVDCRIDQARSCLEDLASLCCHGHFTLSTHLQTVRELLASIGEAHSAWNLATLLSADGVNTQFVDLTGWDDDQTFELDERIDLALEAIDTDNCLPIVTGYARSTKGLMTTFDRGYSEMTFSRLAVLSQADEAIIHKEFHLSSADPKLVGLDKAVPIGRTNYDVADQLANLGMEAIHPRAAKGLRQQGIPLRVRNTFDPTHEGTLITRDWENTRPCVEIIAGCKKVFAIEVFDQDMAGELGRYDTVLLEAIKRFNARIITKDTNANTITHYLAANLKTIKRILEYLADVFPGADCYYRRVAVISAIGSNMKLPGILAQTVSAVASANISVLAIHQSMREVDIQFVVDENDYNLAIKSLHSSLIEVHDHGRAIRLAS
jgi:aspartate kinase